VGQRQESGAEDANLEKGSAAEWLAKKIAMFSKGMHSLLLHFFLRKHAPMTQKCCSFTPARKEKSRKKLIS
jgi:hypothetical protein